MVNKKVLLILAIGLIINFSVPAQAITGSIIDTFIDENLIASRQNVNIDTLSGQTQTPTYSWYATFSYNSNNYAWSSNKNSVVWNNIIPGYPTSPNPGGGSAGNVGSKGQTWCNDTLITSGSENDFSDWFIPSAYELQAGRTYTGSNPWSTGVNDIWSSTTVSYSGDWNRAYVRYESMPTYSIDCRALKAGGDTARPVRIVTALQGNLVSTNLLAGQSVNYIDSFGYNISSLPSGTSLKVQFSQDGSTWYNSSGIMGGWETLSLGTNAIDLIALDWEDPNFYYKMQFTTNSLASSTPVLDEISLNYEMEQIPEPASLLLLGFGVVGIAVFRKKISS